MRIFPGPKSSIRREPSVYLLVGKFSPIYKYVLVDLKNMDLNIYKNSAYDRNLRVPTWSDTMASLTVWKKTKKVVA